MSHSQKLKKHNSLALKAAVAELAAKKNHRLQRSSKSYYCGHCKQNLSIKVYKRHEKLYRRPDQSWISASISADRGVPSDTLPGWL